MTDIFHALILFFQTIYGIILLFLINSFVIWRKFKQKSLKYIKTIFVLWILLLRYIIFYAFAYNFADYLVCYAALCHADR